jgi:hypothetical protein
VSYLVEGLIWELPTQVSPSPPVPPPTPPVPPTPPSGPTSLPHNDYYDDDLRPWWQRPDQSKTLEARLQAARREIGLLPPAEAKKAETATIAAESTANEAVKKAVDKLVPLQSKITTERQGFDLVAAYEREYRRAFRGVLAKARADDAAEAFRQEVRAKLQEQHEREIRSRRIAQDDAEVLVLLGYLV